MMISQHGPGLLELLELPMKRSACGSVLAHGSVSSCLRILKTTFKVVSSFRVCGASVGIRQSFVSCILLD